MIEFLKKINHEETFNFVIAEREILKALEGDCETAVGAISFLEGKKITLVAELFSFDGKERYFFKASKELNMAKELGRSIGKILKDKSKGNYKK